MLAFRLSRRNNALRADLGKPNEAPEPHPTVPSALVAHTLYGLPHKASGEQRATPMHPDKGYAHVPFSVRRGFVSSLSKAGATCLGGCFFKPERRIAPCLPDPCGHPTPAACSPSCWAIRFGPFPHCYAAPVVLLRGRVIKPIGAILRRSRIATRPQLFSYGKGLSNRLAQ